MSVKRTLYSALKVIGVFLIISFMVFRGNLVREVGFGFNLSTGHKPADDLYVYGIDLSEYECADS